MTMTIGLLVFPGMEILDFVGPYQVFATASKLAASQGDGQRFHLVTISASAQPMEVHPGAILTPQATITDPLELSCLIIPGGQGIDVLLGRGDVVTWLFAQAKTVPIIASTGTGALLLAQTGLLNGLEVTTHYGHVDELRHRFPSISVVDSRRLVDAGQFVTSAGLVATFDMALHLLERMDSHELSIMTARHLEL